MTLDHRNPVLRVVPGPSDINANGHIFGGWVLSQMDIAAGIVASRRADGPGATIATDIKVTEALFTFVALDEQHRPRPVDPA
jgi:acyl-CoA thioesterase YciA